MVSVYPCDIHGGRIRGALEGLRITLLAGESRFTRRMRVCPIDLTELLHTHEDEWEMVSDEGLEPMAAVCSAPNCQGDPSTPLAPAFVYVWRRGQSQAEYYAQYCQLHVADLVRTFGLRREENGQPDLP